MDNRVNLVVDGNYLLHISIPYKPEEKVGPHASSYNFIRALSEWTRKTWAGTVIVCWDDGIPVRRRELCPTYKTNRSKTKDPARYEDFTRNREFLRSILSDFAVRSISVPGMEADDLIYGLCTASAGRVAIMSGDMDLSQLVSDKVTLYRPNKPKIDSDSIKDVVLNEDYNIHPRTPQDVVLFKALRGDPSDNIKPVIKPRVTCKLWEEVCRIGIRPTIPAVRELAEKMGIEIGPEFEKNYTVVDLSRSGVAGDAIAHSFHILSQRQSFNEVEILRKFLAISILPGYIHALLPPFQTLS